MDKNTLDKVLDIIYNSEKLSVAEKINVINELEAKLIPTDTKVDTTSKSK